MSMIIEAPPIEYPFDPAELLAALNEVREIAKAKGAAPSTVS